MAYDLGAVVPLGTSVRDGTGALANAGSMALTLTLPDATTVVVAAVAPASTGVYAYDYLTTQSGRHTVRWVASGVNAGAYTDSFDVRDAAPPTILSLADARAHLRMTTTDRDDEIRDWVESMTSGIEGMVGPCVVRTYTERWRECSGRSLALVHTPVIEVLSAVPVLDSGTSYAPALLDVDTDTGIVQLKSGQALAGPLLITYRAGRTVIPAAITAAARIILQHLWRTNQGPGRPVRGGEDFMVTEQVPGFGYAIPNRALQLLEAERTGPEVA